MLVSGPSGRQISSSGLLHSGKMFLSAVFVYLLCQLVIVETATGCGGTLTGTQGSFTSPGHPEQYENNVTCTWFIIGPPGLVIRLSFITFILENVIYDYVEIYDGNLTDSASSNLGRYGGNIAPPVTTSTGNAMTVRFHTDLSVVYDGFNASFVTHNASSGCGGTLTGTQGSFTSPGYPQQYTNNVTCTWFIIGLPGLVIRLSFITFILENVFYDYVEIYDGNLTDNASSNLGRYGGNIAPPVTTSTGNAMTVRFHTDLSMVYDGFYASFVTHNASSDCGGTLTGTQGSFTSPGHPQQYNNNVTCTWFIIGLPGLVIRLSFITFILENVIYDYVEIYDGNLTDNASSNLGRYGGKITPPVTTSTGNALTVRFHTDLSVVYDGFNASFVTYNASSVPCGGRFWSKNGILVSPSFPISYNPNSTCSWAMSASAGYVLTFTFNAFDLEVSTNCTNDYVVIREFNETGRTLLQPSCGNNTPSSFVTPGRFAFVQFVSNGNVQSSGFSLTFRTIVAGCGGTLTGTQGNFTSPGYTNQLYLDEYFCTWFIIAPPGMFIQLSFDTFSLENWRDFLKIYDGNMTDGKTWLIDRYGLKRKPPVTGSTGNTMTVTFSCCTDQTLGGFNASFITQNVSSGCGGTLTGTQGNFSSPGHPNRYPHGHTCIWFIIVPPGLVIDLLFNSFRLQRSRHCRRDYVVIYEGILTSRYYRMLGRHCGRDTPPEERIYNSNMTVVFRSDGNVSNDGFTASFSTHAAGCIRTCSRTLTGTQGNFTTPLYNITYPRYANYTWFIVAPPGMLIQLSFNTFRLEEGSYCPYDYVEIYDGNLTNWAPRIGGRYCGTNIPPVMNSTSNSMTVVFRSDGSVQFEGFAASFIAQAAISVTCGGRITGVNGTLLSPNFPDSYNPNSICSWIVSAPARHYLTFTFNAFDLEVSTNCTNDYLVIREFNETGRTLLQPSCGNNPTSTFDTPGSFAFIQFVSNGNVQSSGFSLTFQTVEECGGNLTNNSGTLTSPDNLGPNTYARECVWNIQVQSGQRVRLSFDDFDIGPEFDFVMPCDHNFVQVFDGITVESYSMGQYCGSTLPHPVVSSGNTMRVVFRTGGSISNRGFTATYTSANDDESSCGGTLTGTQGSFTSPGYPNTYPHGHTCTWFIIAPPGLVIHLSFNTFRLQGGACPYDYVEIYDGNMTDSVSRLGERYHVRDGTTTTGSTDERRPGSRKYTMLRHCGTSIPPVTTSTGNSMTVTFRSNSGWATDGFTASFVTHISSDCNKQYSDTSGRISSPGYPGMYPGNVVCNSTVTAPAGYTLALYFTRFDIESHSNCSADYLAIHNGTSSGWSEVARLCGTEIPDPIFLNSNAASLTFRTDSYTQHLGYAITYLATNSSIPGCGGDIQAGINGSLSSPNFPGNFSQPANCTWTIAVPDGRRLSLNFTYLASPAQTDCGSNFVEVFNGSSPLSPSFGQFCDGSPGTLTASGNMATVRLTSTGSGPAPIFRIVYNG